MRTNKLALFLAFILIFTLTIPALAADKDHIVVLQIDSPYCVQDKSLTLVDPSNRNVTPVTISDRTMLPIRMLIEYFGGTVEWNSSSKQVTCSLGSNNVVLTIDSKNALVNGKSTTLDVPATIRDGRTLVPVRFVSENLNLYVGWEGKNHLVFVSSAKLPDDSVSLLKLDAAKTLLNNASNVPSEFVTKTYSLPSGNVTCNVVTVNLNNPLLRIEARHADNTLCHTAKFSDIVKESGADIVINGNFFSANEKYMLPVGSVMSKGTMLYYNPGLHSIGFSKDNTVYWGDPSVFVRINAWSAYTVNTIEQSSSVSVMYTPSLGSSVDVSCDGHFLTIVNNVITSYTYYHAGDVVSIPSNGCVVFMGDDFTKTSYFRQPKIGDTVTIEPYQRHEDSEGFVYADAENIISGAPRLVKDGAIYTTLNNGFTDSYFTKDHTARTAIGTTPDGKLILVTVKSATIQQMRELMLKLGCEDAVNLDGGSSTAMYYCGRTIYSPGTELTTTLHIYLD